MDALAWVGWWKTEPPDNPLFDADQFLDHVPARPEAHRLLGSAALAAVEFHNAHSAANLLMRSCWEYQVGRGMVADMSDDVLEVQKAKLAEAYDIEGRTLALWLKMPGKTPLAESPGQNAKRVRIHAAQWPANVRAKLSCDLDSFADGIRCRPVPRSRITRFKTSWRSSTAVIRTCSRRG